MFIIAKSKSPCCFEVVKHLHFRYRDQNKYCLKNGYEKWIKIFKREGECSTDNFLVHLTIDILKPIELIFLPQNTTSKL